MLGALFSNAASTRKPNTATSASSKPTTSLESVQEDIHTWSLLFPDSTQLHRSQDHVYPLSNKPSSHTSTAAGGFDCHGDLDLDGRKDIRIMIAQEATALQPRNVLFDSKAGASAPVTASNASQSAQQSRSGPPPLSRTSSARTSDPFSCLGGTGSSNGVFDRPRRSKTTNLTVDPKQRSPTNEPPGGVRLLLDCMFGTAPLSYRGDSTKLHVFPADRQPETRSATASPVIGEGFGSFGRSEGRRRSQLAQSFTPGDGSFASDPAASSDGRGPDSRTVLITRTFSVNPPEANDLDLEGDLRSPPAQDPMLNPSAFPFPSADDRLRALKGKRPKPRRTPMFAIALVLQISVSSSSPAALASRSRTHAPSGPSSSGSQHGLDSFSFSLDSEKASGWTFLNANPTPDAPSIPLAPPSDVDDRLDVVIEHWDIISRVLTTVQNVIKGPIIEQLQKQANAVSNLSTPSHPSGKSPPGLQTEIIEELSVLNAKARNNPSKISHQVLQLLPGAFSREQNISDLVENAAARLALGLRIPRVVTGQGRWGVWREEARWIGRWGGGKEHNFFFFNLLTAFLGNHTEWLRALGPSWYRQRRFQQQRAGTADDLAIPARTVIISTDKMAARRLIFLLSAFLPAGSTAFDAPAPTNTPPANPSAALSRAYSQSLPSTALVKEQSLRRAINKKGPLGRERSSRRNSGEFGSANVLSSSDNDPVGFGDFRGPSHSRRSSDTKSAKASSLSIPQGDGASRKGSAATTATVTPATTVPHFSSLQTDRTSGTAAEPRPGSSGSLASLNLMHTLRRNNSTDHSHTSTESQPHSRWGSLISGFWSNRRDSSTDDSDYTLPPEEIPENPGMRRLRLSESSQANGKLARMVKQVQQPRADGDLYQEDLEEEDSPDTRNPRNPTGTASSLPKDIGTFNGRAIPAHTKPLESPFRLSVDENDGVIDVDVPLPGFLSSATGSPSTSPSTVGIMSIASLDAAATSHHAFISGCPISSVEPDLPVNVAGWLKKYHPDLTVQAVHPYDDLEEDIKRSMAAEPTPNVAAPTPNVDASPKDGWVDVCTTLIADTKDFSVKRIRLRRLVKRGSSRDDALGPDVGPSEGTQVTVNTLAPGVEIEHRFITEPIFDMDGTLIDAVERIIAQSQPSSKAHSTTSSHRNDQRLSKIHAQHSEPFHEVPRKDCQKMVLGALEEVVKSVATERGRDEDGDGQKGAYDGGSHAAESTLREGVRKWLSDVEDLS